LKQVVKQIAARNNRMGSMSARPPLARIKRPRTEISILRMRPAQPCFEYQIIQPVQSSKTAHSTVAPVPHPRALPAPQATASRPVCSDFVT